MDLNEVPDHLIFIGGGYNGLEFGQMFHRFGSKVTIVQRGTHLLSREDCDVADAIATIFYQDGIETLLHIAEAGLLTLKCPEGPKVLTGSHLLAAAGRTPNTDLLNLQATGVTLDDHGYIKADNRLQTEVSGIYALGDVKGGPAFTHVSYDDFRILKTEHSVGRQVPYTVFIEPQLGRVGLTETEARKQDIKTLLHPC